jgi:hypothetical protein
MKQKDGVPGSWPIGSQERKTTQARRVQSERAQQSLRQASRVITNSPADAYPVLNQFDRLWDDPRPSRGASRLNVEWTDYVIKRREPSRPARPWAAPWITSRSRLSLR